MILVFVLVHNSFLCDHTFTHIEQRASMCGVIRGTTFCARRVFGSALASAFLALGFAFALAFLTSERRDCTIDVH